MKKKLESLSKLKIRNGFEKFIEKSINYINIELDENSAIKIVQFINSSNSKLSLSYWILRKNLNEIDAENNRKKYINDFVKSAYKNSNRKSIAKKFRKKWFSTGYSGWTEIRNKKIYCRSSQEFIYLHYLDEILPKDFIIDIEVKIYHYKKLSYKPDIFVYNADNKLINIYEIKDNIYDLNEKYDIFKEYFIKLNIGFELLNNGNLIIKQYPEIKKKLNDWKQSAYIIRDMRGKNNPNYGNKCSEETKKKIGKKSKERWEDKLYRNMMIRKINMGITEETKHKISIARKKYNQINIKFKIDQYNKSPNLCIICNNIIPYDKKHNKTCSMKCANKLANISRLKRKKNQI